MEHLLALKCLVNKEKLFRQAVLTRFAQSCVQRTALSMVLKETAGFSGRPVLPPKAISEANVISDRQDMVLSPLS